MIQFLKFADFCYQVSNFDLFGYYKERIYWYPRQQQLVILDMNLIIAWHWFLDEEEQEKIFCCLETLVRFNQQSVLYASGGLLCAVAADLALTTNFHVGTWSLWGKVLVRIRLTCKRLHHLLLFEVAVAGVLILVRDGFFWREDWAEVKCLVCVGRIVHRWVNIWHHLLSEVTE